MKKLQNEVNQISVLLDSHIKAIENMSYHLNYWNKAQNTEPAKPKFTPFQILKGNEILELRHAQAWAISCDLSNLIREMGKNWKDAKLWLKNRATYREYLFNTAKRKSMAAKNKKKDELLNEAAINDACHHFLSLLILESWDLATNYIKENFDNPLDFIDNSQ